MWDVERYESEFGFVANYGRDLISLLDPKKSELIVDLGCGTGELTEEIAAGGADVIGIDSDSGMVDRARQRLGDRVRLGDGKTFTIDGQADAVFSNAALHWMDDPEAVARQVRQALKPDGRFVAEMGGHRNVAVLLESLKRALVTNGFDADIPLEGYYPRPSEYAAVLEGAGFDVSLMTYVPRPTVLGSSGAAGWVEMFRPGAIDQVPTGRRVDVLASVNETARPALFRDGVWYADYWRLRFVARPASRSPLGKQ